MSDSEVLENVVEVLCRSGWGNTKKENLISQVLMVVREYEDLRKFREEITKVVLK